MFIFNRIYKGVSKKSNKEYYQVHLFERRETQDKVVYFKELALFVDVSVYNKIEKQHFNFGDIVEVEKSAPAYFGGPEQLSGLAIVMESPYID